MLAITRSLTKRGRARYSTCDAHSIIRIAPTSDARWYLARTRSRARVIAVSSRSIAAMLFSIRACARLGS